MMTDALPSLAAVSGLLVLSQLSPGPDIYFVVHTALSRGFRAAMAVAAGICAGFCVQATLVCTVGTGVMQQPWSRYVLYAAAAWLLYLAWRIFPRSLRGADMASSRSTAATLPGMVWQGFLCNILNVKCLLFIGGLCMGPLGQYAGQYPWYAPALVVSLTLTALAGWALWSGLLQWAPVRRSYAAHAAAIDAVFSLVLAAFAVLLLFD